MTEQPSDPFEEFAQRMKSTEETVKKVEEEEPAMPVKGIPDAEIIDRYGQFSEWVKQKKAAEQALMKTKREFYDSLLEDVLQRNGFPEKFTLPGGAKISSGSWKDDIMMGNEFSAGISYPIKANYSQEKLRSIDLMTVMASSSSASSGPVAGLSVKYAANPEAAADPILASDIESAIEEYEATRKIKLTRIATTSGSTT